MPSQSYVRLIDASGNVVRLNGGSLFRADGVSFLEEGGGKGPLGSLSFDLGSGTLPSLLDQLLVSGRHLAAIELFQTTNESGSPKVVTEDVFKDVGIARDGIDAGMGLHGFAVTYDGLVEGIPAARSPSGLPTLGVVSGWNGRTNVTDNRLDTDILGKGIDNAPDFSGDLAAADGTSQPLDFYVRLTDARGANVLGGSLAGTAGWVRLDGADLTLSHDVSFGTAGGGTPAFDPVQLALRGSSLDPILLQAVASQAGLQMEIAAYAHAEGASQPRLVDDYRFGSVTAATAGTRLGEESTNQTYSLSYRQEVIEHYSTSAAGQTTLVASQGWDGAANVALPVTSRLVPTQQALASVPPASGDSYSSRNTYVRFIDASGHTVSVGGKSLFETDAVHTLAQGGTQVPFGLDFDLASGTLSSLLDRTLAVGQHIAAIDVFQTVSVRGSTQVVAEDVFKDVGFTRDDIDAATATHHFAVTSQGHVERTIVPTPDGLAGRTDVGGWNKTTNAADLGTGTDILGRPIDDRPFSTGDVAPANGTGQPLDCYVRLSDAKGNSLAGGSQAGTAGWFRLDGAGLGLSRDAPADTAGRGTTVLGPVQLMLHGSGLDPVLLQALESRTGLQVEIAAYTPADGTSPPRLVDDYRLGGVTAVTAATQVGTGSTDQTYSLSYRQEVSEHYTTTPDGHVVLGSSEGWDASAGATLAANSTLVPGQNAQASAPPVPAAQNLAFDDTTLRFIDASGRAISVGGASLFEASGIGFSGDAGTGGRLGELSFQMQDDKLPVLLDQLLVSGRHLAAIQLFQTTNAGGSPKVTAESVFKDVGIVEDGIDAGTGLHGFTVAYDGLVESTAAGPDGRLTTGVVGGWNGRTNVADTRLDTDILGGRIDSPAGLPAGGTINAAGGQDLDCYVRLSDAKGNSLLGGSGSGAAGWLRIDGASLDLSRAVSFDAAGNGMPAFGPVQLALHDSGVDPVLLQAVASRAGLQMEIAAYNPSRGRATPQLAADYRFGGVVALAAATQVGSPSTQTYTLSYQQEVIEGYTTDLDGATTLAASEGWDGAANAALANTSTLVPARGAQLGIPPTQYVAVPSRPVFRASGLVVGPVPSGSTVAPFADATLSDPGTGAVETLTVVAQSGTFTGTGFTQTAPGTFVARGTVAEINADLAGARFRDTIDPTSAIPARADLITATDTGSVGGVASPAAMLTVEVDFATFHAAPCFTPGTLIRTAAGDVAVEALRVGDRVRTAAGGLRPVRWLGHRRVDCRRHPQPGKAWPVRVRAHAFGAGLPARDLVLSPEHALFLDGHLVPVHLLVDGASVVQEAWERVTYHHVELDRHDVLLAEGLPAESYLDTGNRAQFANAPLVDLHPAFGAGPAAAEACAPLLPAGPRLDALRQALRDARTSRPMAGDIVLEDGNADTRKAVAG